MNLETMRLLVAKGMSAEDILEIAETLDAPKERSAGAIRQARHRAKKKAEEEGEGVTDNVTSDVTGDGNDVTNAPLSLPPNENNSNPPTHTPGTQTPARKADPFPCPDWCEPAVWSDLKRNRRTKKLTNTETAHKRFVSEVMAMADEDWPPGRLVEAIAAKGWGGAHDPRDDRKPGNDRRNSQPAKQGTRTIAERVASRLSAAN